MFNDRGGSDDQWQKIQVNSNSSQLLTWKQRVQSDVRALTGVKRLRSATCGCHSGLPTEGTATRSTDARGSPEGNTCLVAYPYCVCTVGVKTRWHFHSVPPHPDSIAPFLLSILFLFRMCTRVQLVIGCGLSTCKTEKLPSSITYQNR